MPDTHKVTGTVTDAATSAPISTTIRAYLVGSGDLAGETTSDGAGAYTVTLASAADVYVIAPTAGAYLPEGHGPITPVPI